MQCGVRSVSVCVNYVYRLEIQFQRTVYPQWVAVWLDVSPLGDCSLLRLVLCMIRVSASCVPEMGLTVQS